MTGPDRPRAIAVVACAVLEQEIAHYSSPRVVHVEHLRQGLHNTPSMLRQELQAAIDRVEDEHHEVDSIVLGYGLCSRGSEGVRTSRVQMVIARAHDCITHLLGSHQRYAEYVRQSPGTYWYSPGWNKHHLPPGRERYEQLLAEYQARYGEENAEFLMEEEQGWFSAYSRATFVDLGVGVTFDDLQLTRDSAAWLGWEFDRQHGDPGLLQDMLSGVWDTDRFLVLEPGETFRMTGDDRIIETVRVIEGAES